MGFSQRGMEIKYHPLVLKLDVPKLDKPVKGRIKNAIENKLLIDPFIYGIPLRGSLRNLRKMRVGDYRIVFLLEKNEIFVIAVAHRREVYKLLARRI